MRKILLFLIVLGFGISTSFGQIEKFKALFIYNFSKNIEWTPAYKKNDFVIAVLGNSRVTGELIKIANRMKTGNQKIVVRKISDPAHLPQCHILYIPNYKTSKLPQVLASLRKKPTLIVADKKGAARQGASMNFVSVDGQLRFEINKADIAKRGLKITPFLLDLGVVI